MKFVQYQDCKSPHQLPLARELLRRLGLDNFRYVYRDADQAERAELGWNMGGADEPWQLHIGTNPEETHELIENAEVLLTGMREIDLFERRSAKGLKTFYQTERWFKPIDMAGCTLPGWLRLLHPRYMHMALRFRWLVTSSDKFKVLPIGVHSYRDMRFLGVPESQMALWGYFVEPSERTQREPVVHEHECRVLWVGRMLKLKRVDTIIKAFGKVVQSSQCGKDMRLLLVGNGPGRKRLELLAKSLPVSFMDSVPINEVRELMLYQEGKWQS
jgi:glycosyltransferase involved in cell wall biosynthesis